jgi:TPR repeat protein
MTSRTIKTMAAACLVWLAADNSASAKAQVNSDYFDSIDTLLVTSQFEELDKLADELRKTDARFTGGEPKLASFYTIVGAIAPRNAAPNVDLDRSFETRRALLQSWLDVRPKSDAAHIAMAELWITYAWHGRGHAYVPGTEAKQLEAYIQRLQTAQGYLSGLDPKSNPEIYSEMNQLAELSPSPAAVRTMVYDAATHAFPAYFPFYSMRANFLEEKWDGAPGDLAKFTQSLLDAPGNDAGKIAYATIATDYLHEFAIYHRFQMLGLSWPVLKDAFKAMEKHFGLSEAGWDAYSTYAALAGDNAAALEGVAHVREFAEQGYIVDQNTMGLDCLEGIGMEHNAFEAIKWYGRSAAQADPLGEYELGWIYENVQPDGFPKGYEEAMPWLQKAAAQGFIQADNDIGYLYENGYGVKQDYAKAAEMFRIGVDHDYSRSEFHLGTLYDRGLGVEKDEIKALELIDKAAIWNDPDAQKWLAQHQPVQPSL